MLNNVKKAKAKSRFSYLIRWILQENKYLCTHIRLLERDEWGKPQFRASIGLRIFSIKTTKCHKAK